MKKYIALIIAMEEELRCIIEHFTIEEEIILKERKIYVGFYQNKPVILALSGIGKVNASIMTTYILSKYEVDYCISIGIAGGLNGVEVGDFVLCTRAYYGDFDLSYFGYPFGKVPNMDEFVTKDFKLEKAIHVIKTMKRNYHIGSCVSSDKFITDISDVMINQAEVKCVEMESTAILHACMAFEKNCFIVRVISDVLGVTSYHNYREFEKESSILLNQFLKDFMEE